MENNELLNQVLSVIQEQTDVLSKMVDSKIEGLRQEIRDSETRTKVFIENEVSKKIEALFDGYKLTHEKQWELERSTEELKRQVEDLQSRIAAIESRIA